MNYKRAYAIAFQHPDWMKSVLLLAVCVLIPIVGVMVILGYRAEAMDRWIDDDSDERQKPFDFNRFTELLTRGAWPFLYQLIIGIAFGYGGRGLVYGMFIGVVIASKDEVVAGIAFALYFLSIMLIQLVIKAIQWPFVLHGQVCGKFDFGAAWAFAKDFYAKVGVTNLLSIAFLCMILDMLCVFAGMLVCCVGLYAAAAVIMLADNHILWQLYRKYLDKGGRTIPRFEPPMKPDSTRDEGPPDRV